MNWKPHFNERAQSVVEMALILPTLLFILLVFFQLLITCRSAIELQNTTIHAVRTEAFSGRFTNTTQRSALTPWRPFKGISTVKTRGYWITGQAASAIWPRRMMYGRLPGVSIRFEAEFPAEPAVAEEK